MPGFQAWSTEHRIQNRLPELTIQSLTDGAFPNLRGPGVKAASTRAILPFAALLAREMLDRDPSEERAARFSSIEGRLTGEGGGRVAESGGCQREVARHTSAAHSAATIAARGQRFRN